MNLQKSNCRTAHKWTTFKANDMDTNKTFENFSLQILDPSCSDETMFTTVPDREKLIILPCRRPAYVDEIDLCFFLANSNKNNEIR